MLECFFSDKYFELTKNILSTKYFSTILASKYFVSITYYAILGGIYEKKIGFSILSKIQIFGNLSFYLLYIANSYCINHGTND